MYKPFFYSFLFVLRPKCVNLFQEIYLLQNEMNDWRCPPSKYENTAQNILVALGSLAGSNSQNQVPNNGSAIPLYCDFYKCFLAYFECAEISCFSGRTMSNLFPLFSSFLFLNSFLLLFSLFFFLFSFLLSSFLFFPLFNFNFH